MSSSILAVVLPRSACECVQGYNAAIIAYGQTGTGKTFTMEGAHSGPSRGIIPRAIEDVFMYIENDRNAAQSKFLVRASYLQIYNEVSQCDSVVQLIHLCNWTGVKAASIVCRYRFRNSIVSCSCYHFDFIFQSD